MLNINDYQENDIVEITNPNSVYFGKKGVVSVIRKYVIEVEFREDDIIDIMPFMPFEIERD